MTKIFEVTFAQFDPGASNNAVDLIGGQNLNVNSGVNKLNPVNEFTFRPGVTFPFTDYYALSNANNSNAVFNGSYTKRTWVCWYYSLGVNWGSAGILWAERNLTSTFYNGWSRNSALDPLTGRVNDTFQAQYPSTFIDTAGWKLAVMVSDKSLNQTRFFGRSEDDNFDSSVLNSVPSASESATTWIGGSTAGNNFSAMNLGYIATYDEAFNSSQVDLVYEAFLRDSLQAEYAVAVISGIVYDLNVLPISGANVYLLNDDLNQLQGYTPADQNGNYLMYIPFFGDYTITSSNTAVTSGSGSFTFTVTGTQGNESIIFY